MGQVLCGQEESSYRRILCERSEDFNSKLKEAKRMQELDPKAKLICLFTGTKDENTGLSWCSDCTAAEPAINQVYVLVSV
jgi:hypothetical protein